MRHARSPRPALLALGAVAAIASAAAAPQVALAGEAGPELPGPNGQHATIVGGTEAQEGRWPAAAKLKIKTDKGTFGCGGTLISPDIILTAQHCLDMQPGSATVTAYIGKVEYSEGEVVTSTKWVTGNGPKSGDWAVAKLEKPATSTAFAALPQDSSLDASTTFTAVGWGTTSEGGKSSKRLLQVDLPLHTGTSCSATADSEICASGNGTAGKDTCQGDSGGPLFAKDANGGDVQVGITSWGTGCARATKPGHYTKVSAFKQSILDAIKELGGTQPGEGGQPTPTPGPSDPGTPTPGPSDPGTPTPGPSDPGTPTPDPSDPGTPTPDPSDPGTPTPDQIALR